MGKAIQSGILWTFVGVFPAALIVGMLFRFPIPFFGYVSGWESFQKGKPPLEELPRLLLIAAGFYAVLGFVPMAILGTFAGSLAWKHRPAHATRYSRNIALGMALICALFLAVLDKIIGPC